MQGDDWTIKVGANTKSAEDKITALEAKIKKLGSKTRKADSQQAVAPKDKPKRSSEERSKVRSKEDTLLRKQRNATLTKLNTLRRVGGISKAQSKVEQDKINSMTRLVELDQKRLDLSERLTRQNQLNLDKPKKTASPKEVAEKAKRTPVRERVRSPEDVALRRHKLAVDRDIKALSKAGGLSEAAAKSERSKLQSANTLVALDKQRVELAEKLSKVKDTNAEKSLRKSVQASKQAVEKKAGDTTRSKTEKRYKAVDSRVAVRDAIKGAKTAPKNKELDKLVADAKEARKELGKLTGAFKQLKTPEAIKNTAQQLKRLGAVSSKAASKVNKLTSSLKRQGRAANSVTRSVKHLAHSYLSIFAVGAGVKGFFTLGRDMESINAIMLAASGDSTQAAKDMDFVIQKSRELGLNLKESAMGYAKLGAAARGASMSSEETRSLFTGISEATTAFGLNPQRTNLTFLAIQQMLSKGVVSMEELRRQLGEQIPGAFQIAAKAVGMQTNELNELVSSGKLESVAFVKALTAELGRSVKESGALAAALKKVRAEQGRASTELTLGVSEGFGEASHLFSAGFRNLADALKDLNPMFKVIGKVMGATFEILTGAFAAITPIVGVFFTALDNVLTLLLGNSFFGGITDELWLLGRVIKVVLFPFKLLLAAIRDFSNFIKIDKDDGFLTTLIKGISSLSLNIAMLFVASKFKWVRSLFSYISNKIRYIVDAFKWLKGIIPSVTKAAPAVAPVAEKVATKLAPEGVVIGSKVVGKVATSGFMKPVIDFFSKFKISNFIKHSIKASFGSFTGVARLIPLLGSAISGLFALNAFLNGDYLASLLYALSGFTNNLPMLGTTASVGLIGAASLLESKKEETPAVTTTNTTTKLMTVRDINITEATNAFSVRQQVMGALEDSFQTTAEATY